MLNTKLNLHTLTEISLAKHKIWNIEGDRRGDVISCLSGVLWITQDGDMQDYILEPGGNYWVTNRGSVIVQALKDAQFKYSLNELDSHIETNIQPTRRNSHSGINQHLR